VALARPLFSSTRRPPQAAADSATDSDLADMRLTGFVTEPEHHRAIFAVNGATKPLRLTEGEALSGWRIESITPHEVSLSGPGGTKTLQPKLDPNLVQKPPPQPPAANPAARQPAQPPAPNVAALTPPPIGAGRPGMRRHTAARRERHGADGRNRFKCIGLEHRILFSKMGVAVRGAPIFVQRWRRARGRPHIRAACPYGENPGRSGDLREIAASVTGPRCGAPSCAQR
jgi:hypothetical protein